MSDNSVERYKTILLANMREINNYTQKFFSVNKRWEGAITAGLIETAHMPAEATMLFSPLIKDMRATKYKFTEIQDQLVDALVHEAVNKSVSSLTDQAKFAINILMRNLFERTADVGYLATDSEIIDFLYRCAAGFDESDDYHDCSLLIHDRLKDYQYEYTVYFDIIIMDVHGRVMARFDENEHVEYSKDPIVGQTLSVDLQDDRNPDKYVEVFRPCDLFPKRDNVLIYAQKIEHPSTKEALGVLCLCFNFEEEMEGIFNDLLGQDRADKPLLCIIDKQDVVIASSNQDLVSVGNRVQRVLDDDFKVVSYQGSPYLSTTVVTDGYQGFFGLPWYGHAMIGLDKALNESKEDKQEHESIISRLDQFAPGLTTIKREAEEVLDDMKNDSMNGQVKAARFQADGFVEVLRFVGEIGDEINNIFSNSIQSMQEKIVSTLFTELSFRAFQANNIADRNLYERANDVCWWALTPMFRSLLALQEERKSLDRDDLHKLTKNLQYINNLYTPYLRLVLADTKGKITAVSNPPEELEERLVNQEFPRGQEFVGKNLDHQLVNAAMGLKSSKEYCVSEFNPSELYGGRRTYIYSTAVRHPDDLSRPVGVIQIVFDSEPQFKSMLEDTLPRDKSGEVLANSFAIFCNRNKMIISSTSSQFSPGDIIPLDDFFFSMERGRQYSGSIELQGNTYAVGCQVSEGYREYKVKDGYVNDVVCLVFVRL
ncbi:cache domain-containing protein [Desulfonatronovibrio magnus]|uniref:cache domain-containing protein n=1 Tax=Desulfonatronovibrio magnus TaxID=698827 RepID=UPI0005EB8283|nr:cache domain-containing protein [Desulfonatronovibrio magnus]